MEVIRSVIDFMFWLLKGVRMPLGNFEFDILHSILFAGIVGLFLAVVIAIFKGGREE